jgi:hypothetical protein
MAKNRNDAIYRLEFAGRYRREALRMARRFDSYPYAYSDYAAYRRTAHFWRSGGQSNVLPGVTKNND